MYSITKLFDRISMSWEPNSLLVAYTTQIINPSYYIHVHVHCVCRMSLNSHLSHWKKNRTLSFLTPFCQQAVVHHHWVRDVCMYMYVQCMYVCVGVWMCVIQNQRFSSFVCAAYDEGESTPSTGGGRKRGRGSCTPSESPSSSPIRTTKRKRVQ